MDILNTANNDQLYDRYFSFSDNMEFGLYNTPHRFFSIFFTDIVKNLPSHF